MQIIVGLGNPGDKYIKTKHNTGFIILDSLSRQYNLEWHDETKFDSLLSKHEELILCKPQTFMNNSGDAVSRIMNFHKLNLENLIIVHDDVDLDFGVIKFGRKIGSAGHKGVESIIEKLGSNDFWRIRIGIGRPIDTRLDVENYVLSEFAPEEIEKINNISIEEFIKQSRM